MGQNRWKKEPEEDDENPADLYGEENNWKGYWKQLEATIGKVLEGY